MPDIFLLIGNKNYSSWSLRPWLALKQCGIPFEEKLVPLDRPDTVERIRAYSPSGRVPFLRHNGVEVWESLAICEYLSEAFPEARLWPHDMAARAHARAVSNDARGLRRAPLQPADGREPGSQRPEPRCPGGG